MGVQTFSGTIARDAVRLLWLKMPDWIWKLSLFKLPFDDPL
jgi:hypothetical protein